MPCFTCSILSFSEAGNLRLKLNGLGNVNEAPALLCTVLYLFENNLGELGNRVPNPNSSGSSSVCR